MQVQNLKQQPLDLLSKFWEFFDGFLSTATMTDLLSSFLQRTGSGFVVGNGY